MARLAGIAMTDGTPPDDVPFWKRKRLQEMSEQEWESLCDGCGRCCMRSLRADDTLDVYPVDVACDMLDLGTLRCRDYANRTDVISWCVRLRHDNLDEGWLPPSCAYRRLAEGRDLAWWHPLVSGDPDTVRQAGISAMGRLISPTFAGPFEFHTVDWPFAEDATDRAARWQFAMFGGITASVPTPFGAEARVDLDLMAAHCFWLLANGCHSLAILDQAGEVAALSIAERIDVIAGLAARGVPVSKVLAGTGPAGPLDAARVIAAAHAVGVRGILLPVAVPAKARPSDLLPPSLVDLIGMAGQAAHVYLSLAPATAAVSACLTALSALLPTAPPGLRGLRDETPGAPLALAALGRTDDLTFEVYAADDTMLPRLIERGGAGIISIGANLLGRYERALLEQPATPAADQASRTVQAVMKLLRSRPTGPAVKALLSRNTGVPQWSRVRLPMRPPAAVERTALFRAIDATGLRLRPPLPPPAGEVGRGQA